MKMETLRMRFERVARSYLLLLAACGTPRTPHNGADGGLADMAAGQASDASPMALDAAAPGCGDATARFTLLTGADAGLVRDNVTGLVWMRQPHGNGEPPQTQPLALSYCNGRGMRLPTKDEAIALANSYATCAFSPWQTWTSTDAGAGYAWVVDYTGGASPQVADNFPGAVLCVK
jgi:hypothetical protein